MSKMQDLINVTFEETSINPTFTTGDVLGVIINHYWGPVNTLKRMSAQEFLNQYPNELPLGATLLNPQDFYAYAQVLKAIENGISQIEVYRVNSETNGWKYRQVNVGNTASANVSLQQFDESADTKLSIALKYPGYVPASYAPGCKSISLKIKATEGVVYIQVLGNLDDDTSILLEEFEGGFKVNQLEEGKSYYIQNVLNESRFIRCKVNGSLSTLAETTIALSNVLDNAVLTAEDFKKPLIREFSDIEISQATLLISPMNSSEADTALIQASHSRKNCISVVGYPTTNEFSEESIEEFYNSLLKDKFSVFIAGREQYKVMGSTIYLNCVGGWCGCTAKVASDVRINQLASARTYGSYYGVLSETLTFGEVLNLHEKGVISVYNSNTGPQIFGVRTMNAKQNSRFGKANVMRVLASILKQVFPLAMDALHTDVAENPAEQVIFSSSLNSIISRFIALGNIKENSVAICDSSVNNVNTTSLGTVFNIVLSIGFIGLVEKINIKVVATDSSVTAEIS